MKKTLKTYYFSNPRITYLYPSYILHKKDIFVKRYMKADHTK